MIPLLLAGALLVASDTATSRWDTRARIVPPPEEVRRVLEEAMASVERARAEAERKVAEAESARRAAEARLATALDERRSLSERLDEALRRAADLERGIAPDAAELRNRLAAAEAARQEAARARDGAEAALRDAEAEIRRLEARATAVGPADRGAAPTAAAAREAEPEIPGDTRIDLHAAAEEALAAVPGVGAERARAIVWYRERIGRFARVEDLIRVPGFDRGAVETAKPHLKIGPWRPTRRGRI